MVSTSLASIGLVDLMLIRHDQACGHDDPAPLPCLRATGQKARTVSTDASRNSTAQNRKLTANENSTRRSQPACRWRRVPLCGLSFAGA
jgi:hypothetical protein